jgi:hypothetical protein
MYNDKRHVSNGEYNIHKQLSGGRIVFSVFYTPMIDADEELFEAVGE